MPQTRTLRFAGRRTALAAGAITALAAAGLSLLPQPAGSSFAGDNGLIVFASDRPSGDDSRDFELYSMTSTGERLMQLTQNRTVPSKETPGVEQNVDDLAPAVSPNGRRIAFVSNRAAPDGSTDNEIYVMDLDGANVTQLTDNPAGPPEGNVEYDPAWSPDGRRIAFRRGEGRKADIWIVDVATGREQRLDVPPKTGNRAFDGQPAWSPDGNRIAFRKGNGQGSAIWVYDLARDRPFEVIDRDETADSCPSWSPDGGRLAFARGDEGAGAGIWVAAADGSGARQLTNAEPSADGMLYSDLAPAWSPDGRRIAFQSTRDGIRKPPEAPTAIAEEDEHGGGCGGGGSGGHGGDGEETVAGNIELYVMNADGSDQVRLTADDDATSGPQDVAPDWQTIPRPVPFVPKVSGSGDVVITPVPNACTGRRVLRVRVSTRFRARRIARAAIFVDGQALAVDYGPRGVTAMIDLRGRPRGTYRIKAIVRLWRPITVRRGGQRVRTARFVSHGKVATCRRAGGSTARG